jgi:hypothetical protein
MSETAKLLVQLAVGLFFLGLGGCGLLLLVGMLFWG